MIGGKARLPYTVRTATRSTMKGLFMSVQPQRPAFGTVLASHMAAATYQNGRWGEHEVRPVGPIEISPAAHVLHYASTCFEGFKAFRWADGSVHVFRMNRHIQRLQQSARLLA